jgi:hypothetical protein
MLTVFLIARLGEAKLGFAWPALSWVQRGKGQRKKGVST